MAGVDVSTGEVLNNYPGRASTSGPCPQVPWAVHLTCRDRDSGYAYRLLCFDLDAKHGDPSADAAVLTDLLDEVGIAHLVAASGPAGGRHVWVGLAEGADPGLVASVARLVRAVCPSLDFGMLVNPAAGCARPPGAPHRAGGVSSVLAGDTAVLTAPTTTPVQLHALAAAAAVESVGAGDAGEVLQPGQEGSGQAVLVDETGRGYLPGARRALPPASSRALTTPLGPGADASAVLFAVLLGAAGARWRHGEVAALLTPAPGQALAPGLEHARSRAQGPGRPRTPRSPAEAGAVLARQWERAVARAAASATPGGHDVGFDARAGAVADLVQAVQVRADACPGLWAARGGASRRRVLDGLCARQLRAVAEAVDLDVRSLAMESAIGREAARTGLLWLADHGWAHLVRPSEGTHAATWALVEPGRPTAAPGTGQDAAAPVVGGHHRGALAGNHDVDHGPASDVVGLSDHPPAAITEASADVVHRRSDLARSQVYPPPLLGVISRAYWLDRLDRRRQVRVHAVITFAGLGLEAGELSSVISFAGPVTTRQLLGPLGAGVGSGDVVRRALDRLVDHDLVRSTPAGWVLAPAASRDAAAAALGVDRVLTDRKARYDLERALFAWWRAELTWMTAPTRTGAQRRPSPGQTALPLPAGAATGRDAPGTGPPPYPAHPRRRDGRADYRTARTRISTHGAPRPAAAGDGPPGRSLRPRRRRRSAA